MLKYDLLSRFDNAAPKSAKLYDEDHKTSGEEATPPSSGIQTYVVDGQISVRSSFGVGSMRQRSGGSLHGRTRHTKR